ncbi:MAG: ATP-binding cassette domain-containing protein [Candidatus Tectomicrobia bacterium]|nr:ATP-binding cassette domain-containing protein [Candidatus Tectomicrobia bacterium]
MFSLRGVTKRFKTGEVALAGVDLDIGAGEQAAFIGPSGAGKTTLFRVLNCTLRPTRGELRIGGEDAARLRGRRLREVRRRIGTVYQHQNLVGRLRVVHNVLAGRLGAWGALRGLASLVRPAEVETAQAALGRVGIPEKLFSRTDDLSGGERQRVAVARVLVQDPDCILADEPVSSVDPALAEGIVKLLVRLSQESGKTLAMNLHSVDLALAHFPRVIGIHQGAVLFDRKPEEVSAADLQALYPPKIEEARQDFGSFAPYVESEPIRLYGSRPG